MPRDTLSVEGPDYLERLERVDELVIKLEEADWNFDAVPDAFPDRTFRSDVMGKEIIYIHDGQRETIVGKVLLGGVGAEFNLIGPVTFNSEFRVTPSQNLLDGLNNQLGTNSFSDFKLFQELPTPRRLEFYNHTIHLSLRDFARWHLLYGSGMFPSTLEFMKRHFASGLLVHNNSYKLPAPPKDKNEVTYSIVDNMVLTYPTEVVEWMHLPIYGGLSPETIHIEYLLTPQPVKTSHPQLELTHEGLVDYCGHKWSLKRFAGMVQKEGVRGPDISQEGPTVGSSTPKG